MSLPGDTKDAREYASLLDDERAVYDILGERGFTHVECMEGVYDFRDTMGRKL